MKMSKNMKALLEVILETAGCRKDEDVRRVCSLLVSGEKEEREIAEKANLRLNDVRKILFNLHKNNLVSYRRIKNEEKR